MKKRVLSLLLAVSMLVTLCPWALAEGEEPPAWLVVDTTPEETTEETETTTEPDRQTVPSESAEGISLVTDRHITYITGNDGSFGAKNNITRAEAAQIFLRLLEEKPDQTMTFSDVPADKWYAEAAGVMGALGVMRRGMWTFGPDEQITRAEFLDALACFFAPQTGAVPFSDVSPYHWAYDAIRTAYACGWVDGYEDGTLGPDQPITRAQAVVILNRALGRTADKTYVDAAAPVCYYKDVPTGHWAYYDIVEASVPHQYLIWSEKEQWTGHTPVFSGLADGVQLIDGWLYHYSAAKGDFLRNTTQGGLTFGPNGRFTSGSDELDEKLRDIVLKHTNDSMTREKKLRALYVYTRDSFTYLRRPAYEFGATGWMQTDALNILKTGYGNCYSYAALFWYLARWMGYDARIYSGTVGVRKSPHAWVEIDFDGKSYIFDPELEMAYHKKGQTKINLYKYIGVDGWQYRKPATPAG